MHPRSFTSFDYNDFCKLNIDPPNFAVCVFLYRVFEPACSVTEPATSDKSCALKYREYDVCLTHVFFPYCINVIMKPPFLTLPFPHVQHDNKNEDYLVKIKHVPRRAHQTCNFLKVTESKNSMIVSRFKEKGT